MPKVAINVQPGEVYQIVIGPGQATEFKESNSDPIVKAASGSNGTNADTRRWSRRRRRGIIL
jgi:hypothetical protein